MKEPRLSSSRGGSGAWSFAVAGAQLGCGLSILLVEVLPQAVASPGVHLRDAVATLLGWDLHRRLHDTVAGWGPLLLVVAVFAVAGSLLGRERSLPRGLESFVSLFVPWMILTRTADPWWRWTVVGVLPFVVLSWLYEIELLPWHASSRRRVPWPVLLSAPVWMLMLRNVNPWVAPVAYASVLLGLTRLVTYAVSLRSYSRNSQMTIPTSDGVG